MDSTADDDDDEQALPPEFEQGNVEYKLKLVRPTAWRLEHLISQMKWRLLEGLGEAVYEIGVADSGQLEGVSTSDLDASLTTMREMAARLGASVSLLRRRTLGKNDSGRELCEVLVRQLPQGQGLLRPGIDLRLAVLGGADAGKSTLLGVLTSGEKDNGRGRARLNLLRHRHEIVSGRTSSISHEMIGFTESGQVRDCVMR